MQAAARKAAAPLPPVALPPAQTARTNPAAAAEVAAAAAASSPLAAAAVANLGLQLPVGASFMDAVSSGASTQAVPLLEQAALRFDVRHGGLSDDTLNEPVLARA